MKDLHPTSEYATIRIPARFRGVRGWLLSAVLALITLLAAYQVPYTYSLDVGSEYASFFVAGFHAAEFDPSFRFRWTTADSRAVFPGVVQNQSYLLSLRLAAGPRPEAAPPPLVTIYANAIPSASFQAKAELETYSVQINSPAPARGSDLLLEITAPTFVPSKTIAGSSDTRSLGVIIDHVDLAPVGAPAGFIALPPLTQLLGWLFATWLWFALIVRTGWARTRSSRWSALVAGLVLIALGLIAARPWVAAGVWYFCVALGFGALFAPSYSGWINEFRSTRRIPFGFLHTLGIANPRVRAVVELVIVVIIAVNYLVTVVLPLRNQVLGDFFVYYAGTSVWLQGGNLYDQSQLQQFNLTHSLLNGQIGPFTSPPSALLLFAPFALLPIAQAKVAWLIFGFVLLVGSGIFLWLAVRASVPRPPSPIWLAIMFAASQSLRHSFEFGQVNTLYSFLFALGLWTWTQKRTAITGTAMALGAAVKVFSAIFIPYFLLKRAWRALAASLAIGGALFLITSAVTGIGTWLYYLISVLPEASAHRVSAFDQSMLVFLRRTNLLLGLLHDNDQFDKTPSFEISMVAIVITALLLGVTTWWFSRFAQRENLHDQLEFAAVIVVMMLILPRMWEHYLMWLVLPFYLILAFFANRPLTILAEIGILMLTGASWLFSQDSPDLFTRPGWPTALVSIGLYGSFLIYVCLLYLSSRAPLREPSASAESEMGGSHDTQPLEVKI